MATIPGITIPLTIKLTVEAEQIPTKKPETEKPSMPPLSCATCCHWSKHKTDGGQGTWAHCERTLSEALHTSVRSAIISFGGILTTRHDHFCAMWGPRA